MIEKEYFRSLHICLNSKNEILRSLTFEWIKELFVEIQEEKENAEIFLKDFNDYIIENFKHLLLMNLEETQKIIKLYLPKVDPFLFVQSLHDDQTMQLNYIELLFHNLLYKTFDDKLLIYHLELLCKLKPDEVFYFFKNLKAIKTEIKLLKVLNNLKTRDYPLDSSIKICKFYNLPEPQAFLYLRSGAIEKVLDIYLNIFLYELRQIRQDVNAS